VAGLLLVSAEPWHPAATPVMNVAVGLLAVAVMAIGLVPLLPLPWQSTLVRRRSPGAEVPQILVLSAEHLTVGEGAIERRFAWSAIQGLRVASDLVVIDVPDCRVVIPDRAFASPAERAAVLTLLRRERRAASVARTRRSSDPFAPPRRSGP